MPHEPWPWFIVLVPCQSKSHGYYLVLWINSSSHHQGTPVLFSSQESAINKYDWPTILECMFRLRERLEHTMLDMPQWVLKRHPSGVYQPFQARVVVIHCTQYSRNPIVRFLSATPMNHQGNLLSTPSFPYFTSYITNPDMDCYKEDIKMSLLLSTSLNIRRAR
jgi:hypothetical protein